MTNPEPKELKDVWEQGCNENSELCAIMIRKVFMEYRGEATMTTDEAFIFAAGFIAGRESK
jgi:hypothetical protein